MLGLIFEQYPGFLGSIVNCLRVPPDGPAPLLPAAPLCLCLAAARTPFSQTLPARTLGLLIAALVFSRIILVHQWANFSAPFLAKRDPEEPPALSLGAHCRTGLQIHAHTSRAFSVCSGMEFIWALDTEFVKLKKEKQLNNQPFHKGNH